MNQAKFDRELPGDEAATLAAARRLGAGRYVAPSVDDDVIDPAALAAHQAAMKAAREARAAAAVAKYLSK